MHALIGAYSDEGQAWTDELLQVLEATASTPMNTSGTTTRRICCHASGTYMLFLDLTDYCKRTGRHWTRS